MQGSVVICITLILGAVMACTPTTSTVPPQPSPVTMGERETGGPPTIAPTLTPNLVTLPDGSPLVMPNDAEIVPVVQGFYIGFATRLTEPQLFDLYAAWLSQRGWTRVAPTEATGSRPHQRWRKSSQELLIELQSPDDKGRSVAWVRIVELAQPTRQPTP